MRRRYHPSIEGGADQQAADSAVAVEREVAAGLGADRVGRAREQLVAERDRPGALDLLVGDEAGAALEPEAPRRPDLERRGLEVDRVVEVGRDGEAAAEDHVVRDRPAE